MKKVLILIIKKINVNVKIKLKLMFAYQKIPIYRNKKESYRKGEYL